VQGDYDEWRGGSWRVASDPHGKPRDSRTVSEAWNVFPASRPYVCGVGIKGNSLLLIRPSTLISLSAASPASGRSIQ